ncbi:MAG TPA: adenylosuccinate synthase [Planctomycetota bacterium]|nr:adenylosuccinate synthase [Planctomycetota bacterium]
MAVNATTSAGNAGNKVILGLQWGDEGKGKVIDVLSGAADFVVRCQGGANAGHTVVVDGKKTVLHLLPSGALHPGTTCVIGNGVVMDPLALVNELGDLGEVGKDLEKRLAISDRVHLVLPSHKAMDAAFERRKGDAKVGTTLRGIGPCYGDKILRTGMRGGDLADMKGFERKLREHLDIANHQLKSLGAEPVAVVDALEKILPACARAATHIVDTADLLHRAVAGGKRVLFEGAQGVMLDIDYGTYPYVTSSNTGTGGVICGSGLSHKHLGEIIGIVKAYSTRVGGGPFPSELIGARGDALRERGGEYGATTGRPRRCGWLDLVAVRFACRLNGVDTIALTKLDVLSGEPSLPVCVGYELDGARIDTVPAQVERFAAVKPVFEDLPGWREPLGACKRFDDMPANARAYVRFIEERSGVRVGWIGTGPGRDEIIAR